MGMGKEGSEIIQGMPLGRGNAASPHNVGSGDSVVEFEGGTIQITDTALIGTADTLDRTSCQFYLRTLPFTAQEVSDAYDLFVPCNNLLVNGNFDDGVNGWTSMQETNGIGSTLDSQGWQIFPTEVGKTYYFGCSCDRAGVSPSVAVKQTNENGTSLFVVHPSGTGWKSYSGEFTATTTTSAVHFGNGSNTALFDNAMIREKI